MSLNQNIYKFNKDDLYEILEFIKNYHLNPTKGQRGRTNQGKRGFGGELDEWMPGKLLEIAVCRILERHNKNKKLFPDFEIYSNKEVGDKSDPDITEVQDLKGLKRKPEAFVEVKRLDPDAKWLGPRKHQIKNMTDGYMVHATISFTDQKNKKQQDITASALQELINEDIYDLSDFSKFSDLEARIEYIYSFRDLKNKGHFFESGNIIPETEFPTSSNAYKKDGSLSKLYVDSKKYKGKYNLKMGWENRNDKLTFADWNVEGEFVILKNKKGKEYIYANSKTKMFSNVFGRFNLESGKTYKFHFTNKLGKTGGKDNFKSIDDYWFSKKRLDELLEDGALPGTEKGICEIIDKI
jgi:hypothetical protein